MSSRRVDPAGDRAAWPLVGLAVLLLVGTGTALASASAEGDGLRLTVEEWCPPQIEGCLQPSDSCATYAELDRWMGTELRVTDDGEPVQFVEVRLTYTELEDDEPKPREKTEWTDEEGRVSFSLRNAENVTIVAEHDGRRATLEPAPTWGALTVDVPEQPPVGTVTRERPISLAYGIEGTGPAEAPEGTLSLHHPGDDRATTLTLENRTATGSLTSSELGTTSYELGGPAACGLPLADTSTLDVDWRAPDIVLPGAPFELTAGEDDVALDPHGIDHEGERFALDADQDLDWAVTPTDAGSVRDGTLYAGTNASEAELEAWPAGIPGASTSFDVIVDPSDFASIGIDCPSPVAGGAVTTCEAQGHDRFGNPVEATAASWSAEPAYDAENAFFEDDHGPTARYLTPLHGGPVEVTVEQGQAQANTTVAVEDRGPPDVELVSEDPETGEAATIRVSDPSGVLEAEVSDRNRPLDEFSDETGPAEAFLEPIFRADGEYNLDVSARDATGVSGTSSLQLDVSQAPHQAGSTSGSSNSGSSSSTSSSSSTDTDGSTDTTDDEPVPESVETERVSEDHERARVPVDSGSTPTVVSSSGDLELQAHTQLHEELVVDYRIATEVPEGLAADTLRTFDVSVTDTEGRRVPLDRAEIDVRLDRAQLDETGAEPGEVSLFHWGGASWKAVARGAEETSGDRLLLSGELETLSPFAIAVPDDEATGTKLRLEPTGSEQLPRTFVGETDTDEPDQRVLARTADGSLALATELQTPGRNELEVTIHDSPGADEPQAVTNEGRYLSARVEDHEGRTRALEVTNVTVDLEALGLAGDASNVVPVRVEQGSWQPLSAPTRSGSNLTLAAEPSPRPLPAFVRDTQAPRVGLEDPLPDTLTEAADVTVVAGDNLAVAEVRLLGNGSVVDEANERPFTVSLDPASLPEGSVEVTFEAIDRAGNVGETTRSIVLAEEQPLGEASEDAEDGSAGPQTPADREDTPAATPVGGTGAVLAAVLASLLSIRRRP